MRLKSRGNLANRAFFGAAFLTALLWPTMTRAQEIPQNTPTQRAPDDTRPAFSETEKAVNAAANGVPGSVEISAPNREVGNGSHERVIKVDPEKERKAREKAYHDPTFDGSGLFDDIKLPPSATPAARVKPSRNPASLSSGGNFLGPAPGSRTNLSLGGESSPAPAASPSVTPAGSPAETPAESPSPSPSASPEKSAEPE